MAKLKRGTKSQAIRDQLSVTPDAATKDIIATLKARGINVSGQMVSTLKATARGGAKKPRRKKAGANDKLDLDMLVRAKKLTDQFGGIEKAQEALDALAKLR